MALKGKDKAKSFATRLARAAALCFFSLTALLLPQAELYAADYEWGVKYAMYELHGRNWGSTAARTTIAFRFTAKYDGTVDEMNMIVGRAPNANQSMRIGLASSLGANAGAQTFLAYADVNQTGGNSGYAYWQVQATSGTPVNAGQDYYLIMRPNAMTSNSALQAGTMFGYSNADTKDAAGTNLIYPDGVADNNLQVYYSRSSVEPFSQVPNAMPTFVIRYANEGAGNRYQGQPYGAFPVSSDEALSTAEGGINTAVPSSLANVLTTESNIYGWRGVGYYFTADAATRNIVKAKIFLQKVGTPVDKLNVRVIRAAPPYAVVLDTTVYAGAADITTTWGWQPAAGKSFPGGVFTPGLSYYVYFFSSGSLNGNHYRVSLMDPKDYGGATAAGANLVTANGTADYYVANADVRNFAGFARPYANTYGDIPIALTCDNDPPEVVVTQPLNNSARKLMALIEGTAYDNYYIRAGGVQVSIKNITTTKVWDGAGWVDGEVNWRPTTAFSPSEGAVINWSYPMTWVHNNKYEINTKVVDSVGNYEGSWSTTTFFFDEYKPPPNEVPDSTMTFPSNGIFVSALDTISGVATDNSPNGRISLVKWMMWKLGSYWGDDKLWHAGLPPANVDTTWLNSDDGSGSYTVTWHEYFGSGQIPDPGQMDTGTTYYIAARAEDSVVGPTGAYDKNKEVVRSTFTFYWDAVPPTSAITYPQNSGVAGTSPVFYGTYFDQHAGMSPARGAAVKVKLYDKTAQLWYHATGWDPDEPTLLEMPEAAVWASSWTYSPPSGLTGAHEYLLVSIAKDATQPGNYQSSFVLGTSSNNFVCDNLNPVTSIGVPNTSFRNQLVSISGAAQDYPQPGQLSRVEIEIVHPADTPAFAWSGTAWLPIVEDNFSTYTYVSGGYPTWSYTPVGIGWTESIKYRVRARARDNIGNIDPLFTLGVNERQFRYDVSFPTTAVNVLVEDGVELATQTVNKLHDLTEIKGYYQDYPPASDGSWGGINVFIEKIDGKPLGDPFCWDGANGFWRSDVCPVKNAGVTGWYFDASDITWATGTARTDPLDPLTSYSAWSNGGVFRIRTEGRDTAVPGNTLQMAGNREKIGVYADLPYIDLTYDPKKPTSKLTNVPANGYANTLPVLEGTASDRDTTVNYVPRIAGVKLHIFDLSNTKTFNKNTLEWDEDDGDLLFDDDHWVDAAFVGYSSGTWSYNITDAKWAHGSTYRVIPKTFDDSGNYEVGLDTRTFTFDVYQPMPSEAPSSLIGFPPDDYHANTRASLAQVTGTAKDNPPIGKVLGLKIIMKRIVEGTTSYFTGGTWAAGDIPENASSWYNATAVTPPFDTSAEPYTYALPPIVDDDMWEPNVVYYLYTECRDWAGNYEHVRTTQTFVYEIKHPTATVTYPVTDGYVSSGGKVEGVALDTWPGKVNNVFVRIKRNVDSWYWDSANTTWTDAGAPDVWNDVSLHGTLSLNNTWWQLGPTTWETGQLYTVDAKAVDKAGNWQIVYSTALRVAADFAVPSSSVTYPANGDDLTTDLTLISGSASDALPGRVNRILLSYYKVTAPAGFWDRTAGNWSSAVELFYDGTVLVGQDKWQATGASTPTWVTTDAGVDYQIFAKAVDAANNEVVKPGSPALNSPLVQFKLRTPLPLSYILTPDGTLPHWKPNPSNSIVGTAIFSSTVQLRIVDYGGDFLVGGGDDLVYDGASWLPAGPPNDTLFIGVQSFDGSTWQHTLPSAHWNGNRKYNVKSKAWLNLIPENPGTGTDFIIDATPPAAAVSNPGQAYMKALTVLEGAVSDTPPGALQYTYFRVKRQLEEKFWNWQTSTFTALSGGYTDLVPQTVIGGLASYTTDYFVSGAAWEANQSYVVQFYSTDKANNLGTAAPMPFTLDISSPSSGLVVPLAANKGGIKSMPYISGTAYDFWRSTAVEVAVRRLSGTQRWYDGGGFNVSGAVPYWLDVNNTAGFLSPDATSWMYRPADLDGDLDTGGLYLILSRARDVAVNSQDQFTSNISSMVVKVDQSAPTSLIVYPADDTGGVSGRYKPGVVGQDDIRGTAADNPGVNYAGVSDVKVRLSYLEGVTTYYWFGGAFVAVSSETAWLNTALDGSSAPPWIWEYTGMVLWPAADKEYLLETKGRDLARDADDGVGGNGNVEAWPYSSRRFIVDGTPPSVVITTPSALALKTLTRIDGTADAALAGNRWTDIRISTNGTDGLKYWDDAAIPPGWVSADQTWNQSTTLGPTSWYYTVNPDMLKDDVVYTVSARALDYAGNYSVLFSTYIFTYDITQPAVSVVFPLNDTAYSQIKISTPLAGASLQAGQSSANTGVSTVAVQVTDLDGGPACFNGAAWDVCPAWLPAGGNVGSWNYARAALGFANDHRYRVEARATDFAGNDSSVASLFFRYDIERPTTTLTYPLPGLTTGFAYVSGTASDERFGVHLYEAKLSSYTVKVAVKRLTDPAGWWDLASGEFDGGNPNWYEANNSTTVAPNRFLYNLPAAMITKMTDPGNQDPAVTYRIVSWGYDLALNREFGAQGSEPLDADIPPGVGTNVTFDSEKPVTAITMPNVAAHNLVPNITGTADDNVRVSEVRFTAFLPGLGKYYNPAANPVWVEGTEDAAPWLAAQSTIYQTSAAWTYNIQTSTWVSGYTYRVRARARDDSGNYDTVYATATFLYDTAAPESSISEPAAGAHINTLPLTLVGASYDTHASGVNQIKLYVERLIGTVTYYWDTSSWQTTETYLPIAPPYANWTRLMEDSMLIDGELYKVYTDARDNALNQEGVGLKTSFVYDVSHPTAAIFYPYNNGFISATGKVSGGTYDKPNGTVNDVLVRVKKLTGTVDVGKYWSVNGSSWTVDNTANSVVSYGTLSPGATWWQLNADPYPWATNETYEMNAWAYDKAGNYQFIYATATNVTADFTNPVSTITSPLHGVTIEAEIDSVSGNASDANLEKVLLSYRKMDTLRYWNLATHAWDSVPELFYPAALIGNNWTATGASTPTWIAPLAGMDYQIFAKAVDKALNEVPKPGLPGPLSSFIQFTLKPPPPVSAITTPDLSVPHYKPVPAPQVIGTAVYATTVAVRVVDYGPDLVSGGADNLAWNGADWLPASVFTGFAGVDNYVAPNWQWTIPSAKWNVNRRYRVISQASHEVNLTVETPGVGVEFIVDSTAPSAGVTMPDKTYMRSLTALAGTLSDVAPGDAASAYFRVKRQGLAEYWNWQASTFTALNGQYTDLPAALAWNETLKTGTAQYTTGYFLAGLAFEQDRSYSVELYVNDKAGNPGSAAAFPFSIDVSSPVARVLNPVDANKKGLRVLDGISGTASDNWLNSDVQIAMQQWDNSNNLWYGFDGLSWDFNQASPYWISMKTNGSLSNDATSWMYAPGGLDGKFTPGISGYKYMLLSKAVDTAGNAQSQYTVDVSSVLITMDKADPSSVITLPLDDMTGAGGRYKAVNIGKTATASRFNGTAKDDAYDQNNSGVAAVQVRLSYLLSNDTYYWNQSNLNFSSWTVTAATAWAGCLLGGSAPNWTWTFLTDISWPAGDREYKLESRAMDDARASDDTGEGNWEEPVSRGVNVKYFIVDDTPPTVVITTPAASAVSALPGFGGDAAALIAGLNTVQVQVSTGTGINTRYWNGAAWQATEWPALNDTKLGPTSWYYTLSPLALKDDVAYTFVARALDYAGNVSAEYSTYTVTYDITGPLVSLSFPVNNTTYSQILLSTPLAGTATNNQTAAFSGPSTVAVAITDLVNSTCFNGASFAGCSDSLWLPAQNTVAAWTFTDKDLSFISDHNYKYEARSADAAGNYSGVTSVTTKFDLDIPTSTVTGPMTEYVKALTVITGTAQDERNGIRTYEASLGTYTVKMAIRIVGGNWWNGSTAFDSANPKWYEVAVNTAPYGSGDPVVGWQYLVPADVQGVMAGLSGSPPYLRSYLLVPWAYDLAQNREFGPGGMDPVNTDVPGGVGRILKFDNILPVSVTTAPANISYKRSVLSLYGVATDTGVVTGVQVLVKARGGFSATWKGTYANNLSDWDFSESTKYLNWVNAVYANGGWSIPLPALSPVNNSKISVWTRATDVAGNVENTPSDAQIIANLNFNGTPAYYFTFDDLIPETGVTAPDRYALSVATGIIAGTAFDAGTEPSNVSEVLVRLRRSDDKYWSFYNSNWTSANPTDVFNMDGTNNWTKGVPVTSQDDGYAYYVYHYAKDNALNNTSGAYFSTFTFIVDLTTPTSRITFPAHNSFIGSVPAIAGTADDAVENLQGWTSPRNYEAGISTDTGVDLAIQRLTDDKWWDGTGFGAGARQWKLTVFTGASSGTWVYNLPGGAIADGTTYYAMTRVRDLVGNIQTIYTTNYFTGDTTPPDSRATAPTGSLSNILVISGTAQDTLPGELLGSNMVRIALRKITAPQACYDNASNSWTGCPAFAYPNDRIWFTTGTVNDVRGQPGNWTWNTSAIGWANGHSYDIQALAIDKAGNVRCQADPAACPGQNSPDLTFSFVSPAANTFINTPDTEMGNYRGSTPAGVSDLQSIIGNGTNLRASGSVQIRIKRLKEPVAWWYQGLTEHYWLATDTYTFVNATAGAWSLGISGLEAFTVDNATYTFSTVGYNSANEAQSPPTNRTVIVDNTMPLGAVLSPGKPYINSMPVISGTAADPGREALAAAYREGMNRVLVMIRDDAGKYWNGQTFDTFMSSSNILADQTLNWSTATAVTAAMRDGRSYTVFGKPEDKAGNRDDNEGSAPSYSVIYDTTTPKSWIAQPAPLSILRSLDSIAGTAMDPAGTYGPLKSDLVRVELQIYEESTPKWWHHGTSNWSVTSSSFNAVTGTDNWNYTNPALPPRLTSGWYYILQSRAVDAAGNNQAGFINNISSLTFIWDVTPPVTFLVQPMNGENYKPSALTGVNALNGTASDAVLPYTTDHLSKVQMNLSYLDTGVTYYWNDASFTNAISSEAAWVEVVGTATWRRTFDGVSTLYGQSFGNWISDKDYTLMIRAFDTAAPLGVNGGNEQDPLTIARFVVDGTPPVSRVSTPTANSFIQGTLPEISGTSYAGRSGQAAFPNGLKLKISNDVAGDTYYWNGHTAQGWSSGTPVELPVQYTSSQSTITWRYPPATYDAPTILINSQDYTISIAGIDKAGNTETAAEITVTSDFNYPVISISTPMAGASSFYGPSRPTGLLTGNSADTPAQILPPIKIQLSNISEPGAVKPKWDGFVWTVVTSTWLGVSDLSPWTYPQPAWPSNKRLKAEFWAVDYAGNQVPDSTYTREFIYDVNKPSSTIAAPSAAFHTAAQVAAFSGGAADWINTSTEAMSGLTPDGIEIQIVEPSGNKFNGVGFAVGDYWRKTTFATTTFTNDGVFGLDIVTAANWTYPRSPDAWPPALVEKSTYTVRVRSTDRSLNTENYVEKSFCYDASAPTATITMPGNFAYVAMPVISGTLLEQASYPDPADGIQVVVQRVSDLNYWNGAVFEKDTANFPPDGFNPAVHWRNATTIGAASWSLAEPALNTYFNSLRASNASLQFRLYLRAKDIAGNQSRAGAGTPANPEVSFTVDPIVPSSKVTYPSSGAYVNAPITRIGGTATDTSLGVPSGLNSVRLRFSKLNLGGTRYYYNWVLNNWGTDSAAWIFTPVDLALDPWNRTIPASAFTGDSTNNGDGYRFEVQSETKDKTQVPNGGPNTEVLYATSTFVMDLSTPTAAIQQPPHLSYFRALSSLSGTSEDVVAPPVGGPAGGGGIPSGLASMEYVLTDTDRLPNRYWDFNAGAWSASYVSSVTAPGASWTMAALPANFPPSAAASWAVTRSSATFLLKMKFTDNAVNVSSFTVNYSTFTLDLILPVSKVTSPGVEDGFQLVVSSIVGTATDFTSGISTVQVRIQQDTAQTDCTDTSANGRYWGGSAWQAGEKWLGVNSYTPGDTSWTLDTSAVVFKAQCYYVIKSSAVDNVSNGELNWGSRRFKFTPPPAFTRVTVPDNLKYYKAVTLISGTANADAESVALQVRRLSNNDYWNFGTSSWQVALTSASGIAPAGGAWTYNTNLPPLVSGSSYTFRAIGKSFSEVDESAPATNQVYFDTLKPEAFVQVPDSGQLYYNSLPKLGGTATDPPGATPPASGISRVWAEIADVNGPSAGKFWDNATSTFTAVWNQAGNQGVYYIAASSWTYSVAYPTAAYTNGVQYQVRAKSLDNTYNNSSPEGTESDFSGGNLFSFDVTVPTAVVTAVSAAQSRSGVAVASGTILEDLVIVNVGLQPGVQIQGIRVHLKDNNLVQYWNGGGWDSNPAVWAAAAVHQSSWSLSSLPAWADDGSYTVWAEASDKAGNTQTVFAGNGSSVTFTVDKAAPTLAVLNPAANTKISTVLSVSGTANDPNYGTNSGIAGPANIQAQVSYLLAGDTYYYDNAATFSSFTLSDTNSWWPATTWTPQGPSSGTWIYDPAGLTASMVPDKVYRFRARAQDNAIPVPNPAVLTANAVTNLNVIYDVTPPVSRITFPYDLARIRTLVSIAGTSQDNLAGISTLGQLGVSIAEKSPAGGHWNGVYPGTFTLTSEVFQPLSAASLAASYDGLTWSFTAPNLRDGYTYIIKVRASDDVTPANTEAVISSVTFTYDTTPPAAAITYPYTLPDSRGNLKALVTVSGTAYEQFVIRSASISVQEADTLLYYDTQFSTFNSLGQKWITAGIDVSPGPNYTWSVAAPPLTDNKNYNLQVTANDAAGNALTPGSPIVVRYDVSAPLSRPVLPVNNGFIKSLTQVTGTAADINSNPSGISGSQVKIQRNIDSLYWNGSTWGTEAWLDPMGGTPWTKNTQLPPSDNFSGLHDTRQYTVMTRAYDVAGNTQSVILAGNVFTFDISSPTAFVSLPLDGSRYNTLPQVSGTAEDLFNVNFPQVRLYDIPLNKFWMEGTGSCGGRPVLRRLPRDLERGPGLLLGFRQLQLGL